MNPSIRLKETNSMNLDPFIAKPGSKIKLKDFDPRFITGFEDNGMKLGKEELKEQADELLIRGLSA